MGENFYIGDNGRANKVRGVYIGIEDKAKKIIKGYIGVGGVAAKFYGEKHELYVDFVLDNNDWETISSVAKAGQAANYWSVGDCKRVHIKGEFGGFEMDEDCYCYIIEINRREFGSQKDTIGRNIHFQFGKTAADGGKTIAFVDSTYGVSGAGRGFCMNLENSMRCGWRNSHMRKVVCAEFYESLPEDLRSVVSVCKKYGAAPPESGSYSYTHCYELVEDRIFLLSEGEVFGSNSYSGEMIRSGSANINGGMRQYPYYNGSSQRTRYKHSSPSSGARWWLRSVSATAEEYFCVVSVYGYSGHTNAYNGNGFAPAFMVGDL